MPAKDRKPAAPSTRVLVIDDEEMMLTMLGRELPRLGFEVETAANGALGLELAAERRFDVAIVDMSMPEMDGLETLAKLRASSSQTEIILLTGHGTIENAVAAMRSGGFDYLTKPCRLAELSAVIERAASHGRLKRENQALRRLIGAGDDREGKPLIAESEAMQRVLQRVERAAGGPTPVLLQGESGTGKELVAHMIHKLSPRAEQPFVVLNCSAINESLLESELFGHQRGSFTGASERRLGLLEAADGGTIFLDEISEMALAMQPKILRAVESGEIRRVGDNRNLQIDVRVVAATNRDLAAEAEAGRFRRDLYYRLSGVEIRLPPLRERKEDLVPLASHFLERSPNARRPTPQLDPEALETMLAYDWPGNVRELRNCIDAALLLSDGDIIEVEDLPPAVLASDAPAGTKDSDEPGEAETFGEIRPLDAVVQAHIDQALIRAEGNKSLAARRLGIDPKTLYRHLRKRPRS